MRGWTSGEARLGVTEFSECSGICQTMVQDMGQCSPAVSLNVRLCTGSECGKQVISGEVVGMKGEGD